MLLHKLDTTDYSCLVLPRTLTNRRHRFLCFLRAAQLSSQDCVCSPVLLVQYSRVHRSATSATVVFRGGKPAHRKVCWLASYACSHRGIHSALRSQHCRKSEYLTPRITTYDSSYTRVSRGNTDVRCPSVKMRTEAKVSYYIWYSMRLLCSPSDSDPHCYERYWPVELPIQF